VKKRDLEKQLKALGWWQIEGTKHDKWTNGEVVTMVPRHTEINEYTAKGILKTAKQNPSKGPK
jgi:predicted RNA binding protein YcfA (HicA-like mRNA interferase family)